MEHHELKTFQNCPHKDQQDSSRAVLPQWPLPLPSFQKVAAAPLGGSHQLEQAYKQPIEDI